ncbi:hypothetical protein [Mesorhizobium sp. 113-3-3]|uniref:hypothetical protein n=1 Tax=Mesorhizobium sp. 113-3-3 TaxID=2744516 RepID=UPI001927B8FB|nr:hypothetical protein [Mesorhizobium sp. 113-3-3]BCG83100.1 hypothetical protein MesoLj113b_66420 [Mesorhizobium sp. 113-3-3]
MRTRGVQIFTEPVSQDYLSDDPLVATHISNRLLKAAHNATTTAKSEPEEVIEAKKIPSRGVGANKEDNEIADPLLRVIVAAYRSDIFPVLLLLAIYTLVAFGAALFVLLGWILHTA